MESEEIMDKEQEHLEHGKSVWNAERAGLQSNHNQKEVT
jgi:hypothetical protein